MSLWIVWSDLKEPSNQTTGLGKSINGDRNVSNQNNGVDLDKTDRHKNLQVASSITVF